MMAFDSDDSSEPSEVIEYKGYSYEKKWTCGPVGNWTLWKCTKRGCTGDLVITAIRTKRWRRKRFVVFRDVSGKKLMAYFPRKIHNHSPQTPNGKEIPEQNRMTVVTAKVRLPTPPSSLNERLTDSSAVQSFKVLNETDTFNSSETKSLHSIMDVENSNSINLDNLSKSMETGEQTVTNFDEDIKIPNINDTMEFKVDKPVDLNANSEERYLKDISITVDDTNIIENIEKNEVVQIKHGYSDMSSQDNNEKMLCHVCDTFFHVCYYNQHIQTTKHLNAYEEYFKDRIDFENYRIFSCSVNATTEEFFKSIKQDFTILVNHLLLEHNALMIDIHYFALYHEDSLNVENKNIAEVKHFDVYNKKLTKNTTVNELYEDIVNSFLFQCNALKTSESSWTLEETLYVEITLVKKLFENEVVSKSLDKISHNNEIINNHINSDNLQKTEPLQLIRCKQCCVYVIQKNYNHHLETTAHKISLCYLKNDKIQINGVQCDDRFLSCRILSPEHVSIDNYFQSIESDVLELISKIMRFQNNKAVNVNIKLFCLYNHNSLMSNHDNLGDVKSFMIKNEILSGVSILLHWFQQISNTLKSHHQEYLKSMPQSYYLDRVMFLELYFYDITNI
ncbi:hypothetical protein AGLY_007521 [Aphis glycines]|uniref:Uncharacterized protein n=1 Tax=Aphis glycines TaxID=307491 RepID=A0A6G0TPI4_APHGL|nr:hypothetical protein AGLY_007521 [Aphis glycines]